MLKPRLMTSRQTFPWIVVLGLVSTAILVPSVHAQDQHRMVGSWRANLAKSQRHPNHQFQSLRLVVTVREGTVLVTYSGVNMGGEAESGTSELHPDGKEHPIEAAPGVVEVSSWQGPDVLKTQALKDGKIVGESRYEVSSDGTTLTAWIKGVDEHGAGFEQVIVFDRE